MNDISGVLLAGGLSRRMGGADKARALLGGKPIIERVIGRAVPQVAALALNSNGDPADFQSYGLPVIADSLGGHLGPLAGVLTGMEWTAAGHPDCRWVATFPCDAPFLPRDLVARLAAAAAPDTDIVMACSNSREHPVAALWSLALATDLRQALIAGTRRVRDWMSAYRVVRVDFPTDPVDPFFNANRPADFDEAARLLALDL